MKRAQLLWLFLRLVGMLWQTVLALLIVDVPPLAQLATQLSSRCVTAKRTSGQG